jgi:hypothetical protein
VPPDSREDPVGDGGREHRGGVDEENELVPRHGDGIGTAQVATNEQCQLTDQRVDARVAEVRPQGRHPVGHGRAQDQLAGGGQLVGKRGELGGRELTREVVGGKERADHAAGLRGERRRRRLVP